MRHAASNAQPLLLRVAVKSCCIGREGGLTHSILTAKQFILIFSQIFGFAFQFLRLKRDCYVKLTSRSTTRRTIKATFRNKKKLINELKELTTLRTKNGPVGWNGLIIKLLGKETRVDDEPFRREIGGRRLRQLILASWLFGLAIEM